MKDNSHYYKKLCKGISYAILLLVVNTVYSQSTDVRPKFLTFFNLRSSLAIGGDVSYLGKNNKIPLIQLQEGGITNENIRFRELANWNVNIGLDVYSPNGIVGFFIGAGFNSQKYSIEGTQNQRTDSIRSFHIEIPAYLKFRFGKISGKTHFWWALGGGYSIPYQTSFHSFDVNQTLTTAIKNIELFKTVPYASSLIGYEVYLKSRNSYYVSNLRLLLYAQVNYDLENRVLNVYDTPTPSSLSDLNAVDIRFLKISAGLKFLFG
jgi:hypothetical protein